MPLYLRLVAFLWKRSQGENQNFDIPEKMPALFDDVIVQLLEKESKEQQQREAVVSFLGAVYATITTQKNILVLVSLHICA